MSRRILAVGDVHATPDELDDCYALMAFVARLARLHRATVLFLGDQYHTHAVIRSEVLWFWRENFRVFGDFGLETIALIGNHDFAGEGLRQHVMVAHEDQVTVVDRPQVFPDFPGVLFMPYEADRERFVQQARQAPHANTLICHQTFSGAAYDNGFYAKDGVDPESVPQEAVISGHIHCVSDDTEILTQAGWRQRGAIAVGDLVVTASADGSMVYQPVLAVVDRERSAGERMFNIRSKHTDLLVTEHHRNVSFRSTGYRQPVELVTWEIADFRDNERIPIAGQMRRVGVDMSDDEIRLCVWVAADGTFDKGAVVWHLKKPRKIYRLTALLERLAASHKIYSMSNGTVKVRLGVNEPLTKWLLSKFEPEAKRLPDELRAVNLAQWDVLFDEYAVTGGQVRGGNPGSVQLITTKQVEVDILQEAAALNGAMVSMRPKRNKPQYLVLNMLRAKHEAVLGRDAVIEVDYEPGRHVWCVTVANGTVLTRRNGKVAITGNCPQSFGKVTYLGAPRWRTLSDAGVKRAIWLLEFGDDGRLISKEPFDTSEVCRQIFHLIDTPDDPVALPLDPRHDWRIDIKGPEDWLERRKAELALPGVKVRVFKTDRAAPKVRESEGVSTAFWNYLNSHYSVKYGTDLRRLGDMARERLDV